MFCRLKERLQGICIYSLPKFRNKDTIQRVRRDRSDEYRVSLQKSHKIREIHAILISRVTYRKLTLIKSQIDWFRIIGKLQLLVHFISNSSLNLKQSYISL